VKAVVNGEAHELPDGATVGALLEMLGAKPAGIAVAQNERVVPRAHYDTHVILEGDRIEIIRAVAGG
jgi:sulfur carrier protein